MMYRKIKYAFNFPIKKKIKFHMIIYA